MPYLLFIFLLFSYSFYGQGSNTQKSVKINYTEKCKNVFEVSIKCYEDVNLDLPNVEFMNKLKVCNSGYKERLKIIGPLLGEVKRVYKLDLDKKKEDMVQLSMELSFCSLMKMDDNKKVRECFINAMNKLENITCLLE